MQIGDLLLERGLITESSLDEALERQKAEGGRLGYHLVVQGAISEEDVSGLAPQIVSADPLRVAWYMIDELVTRLVVEQWYEEEARWMPAPLEALTDFLPQEGSYIVMRAGDRRMAAAWQELLDDGEMVYSNNCAQCHGDNGQGQPGAIPALVGNDFVMAEDPAEVIEVVINGRGGMPGFGGQLSQREIAAVITYIRNTWGNEAPAVTEEEVGELQ